MAADKSLVEGAYRAAMANKPGDYTKLFAQQGAAIANIAMSSAKSFQQGNALKNKKAKDKDYEDTFKGLNGNVALTSLPIQQELAQRVAYQAQSNYNTSNFVGKNQTLAQVKDITEQQTSLANLITTASTLQGSKGEQLEAQFGSPKAQEYMTEIGNGKYKADVNDKNQLTYTFDDGEMITHDELTQMVQFVPAKDLSFQLGNIKSNIKTNAAAGGDFDPGMHKNTIIKEIIPDASSLYSFSSKSNFTNSNGDKVNFGELIEGSEVVRKRIADLVENDPKFASFDPTPESEVTKEDLEKLLTDLKSTEKEEYTADLIDYITNPNTKNGDGFNLRVSQDIIANALNDSLVNDHNLAAEGFKAKNKSNNTNDMVRAYTKIGDNGEVSFDLNKIRTNKVQFVDNDLDSYNDGFDVDNVSIGKFPGTYIVLENQNGIPTQIAMIDKNQEPHLIQQDFAKYLGSNNYMTEFKK